MKIKKLVLQNINSLYGKWEIDFDCDAFRKSGIFAITGATGSGKSTILDAMCLALYGETPRLKKGTCEAVSHGCNECMCELTFQDKDNETRTAKFAYETIKRGENKGKMKDNAVHSLSRNGTVVEEKTTDVKKKVESITGLDAPRFYRAVLLAQGSFDAFLSAGKDNGEILERITGTKIYSDIAAKLKERHALEQGKLDIIKAQCDGVDVMSEEDAEQVRQSVVELDKQIAQHTAAANELNKLIQKYRELELHSKNLEQCAESEKKLAEDEAEFAPQRARFEAGKKVLEADEKYHSYKELADRQAVAETALAKNNQLLKSQEITQAENSKKLETAEGESQKFEQDYKALNTLLTKVRTLDADIKSREVNTAALEGKRRSEISRFLKLRCDLSASRNELAALEENNRSSAAYLAEHACDGELAAVQKVCGEWLEHVQILAKELKEFAKNKSALLGELEALQKKIGENDKLFQAESGKCEKLGSEVENAEQKIAELLDGSTLEHWKNQRDIQQKCYEQATLLKSFDDHRKQLVPGKECPLCGATEHPWAQGNVPEPEKELEALNLLKKRIDDIDKAEKLHQKKQSELNAANTAKLQCHNSLEQLKIQFEAKKREFSTLCGNEEKTQTEILAFDKKTDDELGKYGLKRDKTACTLPDELAQRISKFESCKTSQEIFDERSKSCKESIVGLCATLQGVRKNGITHKKEFLNAKKELTDCRSCRNELFGSRDPEAEACAAEKNKKNIDTVLEKARQDFTEIATNLKRTTQEIEKLAKEIKELMVPALSARENFLAACKAAGVTEDEFHALVLSKDEMTTLSATDASLAGRRKELSEQRKNCEREIAKLNEELTGLRSRNELEDESAKISEEINSKNQTVGDLRRRLKDDEEAKERMKEQHEKLIAQQKVMELWNRLNDLIGKSDKFQRFAQGITLEHLLSLANVELEKFSGRYRLLRSMTEELGIEVADKDQGDFIRSCKTLSGGERFLVSLSLALGLSQMAGEKIRVDSLFLDEGFGTLDADTLEIALGALSNLRNRGKLVGVISHVAAFSEKIPCVIEVNKSGGGRSTLQGPGVKAV